jgi:hypothetical protein
MKKFYLFVLLCLAAVLSTACHKSSTLSRITLPAIDSLLQDNPDSAYNALADIPVKSIYSRRDRAYYALLLTQARHKNYLPLNDDSLINVAVTYYKGKKDYEKFAKALLYKGICIEESNDPQKAIEIYAQAEQVALQTDDYLTLGLINSQMAGSIKEYILKTRWTLKGIRKLFFISKRQVTKETSTRLPVYWGKNTE